MRRLDLDVDEIVRLYVDEGMRASAIAERMGCSEGPIYGRLVEAGIGRTSKAGLDRAEVCAAYEAGASLTELAAKHGVVRSTVSRSLRLWGVQLRTLGETRQPKGRRPCPASLPLRAYMLGFIWGDMAVDLPSGTGQTVAARGSTTHEAQIRLVRELFEPFGRVTASDCRSSTSLRVSLDPSFAFLAEKYGNREVRQ